MSNIFFEVLDSYHESSPNRDATLAAITDGNTPDLSQEARSVLGVCLSFPPGAALSATGLHARSSFPSLAYVEGALAELKARGYLRERDAETQWPALYATAQREPATAAATPATPTKKKGAKVEAAQ